MSAILNEETSKVLVTCEVCNAPITHSNDWGMFCDKECGIEESKVAKLEIDKLISAFGVIEDE